MGTALVERLRKAGHTYDVTSDVRAEP